MRAHTHALTRAHMHAHTRPHTRTHTHAHASAHTHAHAPTGCSLWPPLCRIGRRPPPEDGGRSPGCDHGCEEDRVGGAGGEGGASWGCGRAGVRAGGKGWCVCWPAGWGKRLCCSSILHMSMVAAPPVAGLRCCARRAATAALLPEPTSKGAGNDCCSRHCLQTLGAAARHVLHAGQDIQHVVRGAPSR